MASAANNTDGDKGVIALASGGTGGHLFPAQSLAEELSARGWRAHLLTDTRGAAWQDRFAPGSVHVVPSSTVTPGNPFRVPVQLARLVRGLVRSRALLRTLEARCVVGFGGYPSLPPVLAARVDGTPTMVHEQNAVAGRANRLAVRLGQARFIATSFENTRGFGQAHRARVRVTGNPVRAEVLQAARRAYETPAPGGVFRLAVFGGSQGAQFFSQFLPKVVTEFPSALRRQLRLVQQCRPEDIDEVRAAYDRLGVKAVCEPFFADLPARMARSHLIVCRAGASTIAELGVIGRPAILVPLPHALDDDQLRNAEDFSAAGAGWVMRQDELLPDTFASFITMLRFGNGELARAAEAARQYGLPGATGTLADLVEQLASGQQQEEQGTT